MYIKTTLWPHMCFPCQIIIVGGSAARCLLAYFVCCAKQVQQQCHLATGRFLLFAVCTVLLQALSDACTITSLGSLCFLTCLPLAASMVFYQSLQAPCWPMTYCSSLWCVYLPYLNTSQRKPGYILTAVTRRHTFTCILAQVLMHEWMLGLISSLGMVGVVCAAVVFQQQAISACDVERLITYSECSRPGPQNNCWHM